MRIILAKTDGSVLEVFPQTPSNDPATGGFTLKEMYSLIGCDLVEHLDLVEGVHLWCDEEGRLKDEAKINVVATKYFHKAFPPDMYDWSAFGGVYEIVGDLIIVDSTKEGWL